ncbi:helix-turn-helix domain-containing protein [Manganibacter manganicus]|nr:transcriptional regulator [Pseudaminobacter manganicus]
MFRIGFISAGVRFSKLLPFHCLEKKMSTATPFALPEAVLNAISQGTNLIRAYREYLGYSIDHIAITSGLTVEEVECVEAGHRFDKGYRSRLAHALGLPETALDDASGIAEAA